ncbi:helix-turn-helix transcriptional regulator [Actinoallomurus sp. NPDC050550]|uniref:helix-turn-helix domain-containing protein n=1 Tax=Actinoallomurus sp. NPDC050550 TaxID=3154937 RepID=UPI0033DACB42
MSNEPIDPKSSARAFYAVQLKRLRSERKLTQAELGGHPAVMVSDKLIGHVENCYRPPTLRLSEGLDKAFDMREFFEGMYAAIKRESGIPSQFWDYAEQESLACGIKSYQHFLVQGLVQTEEYAREVLRVGQRPDRLDELVAARLNRQEILRSEDPPWLTILLDESVIRRVVGNRGIMQRQLEHLLAMMQGPNVVIRIVPSGAPVYLSGAFNLLSFHDAPSIAYVEGVGGHGQIIEPGRQVSDLEVLFDQAGAQALPVGDSAKLIRAVLEDL